MLGPGVICPSDPAKKHIILKVVRFQKDLPQEDE